MMNTTAIAVAMLTTGAAAYGVAAGLDRLTAPLPATPALPAFVTERTTPGPEPTPVPSAVATPMPVLLPDPVPMAHAMPVAAQPAFVPPTAVSDSMSFLPVQRTAPLPLDADAGTRRYDFTDLPMIGVYR